MMVMEKQSSAFPAGVFYQTMKDAFVKDGKTLSEEKIKEEYPDVRYWSVERDNNKIYIVKPITYEEALLLADLNKNILCVDHAAAQEIAKNYPDAFICHDKNNDNYLYHYHLNQKHKNHIWFFGPPI